ncbi:hypothetical protein CA262_18105 [Sphingobium sp. GW456-12-10-14-TSB1]|uniref:Lipoprotein n=2 Tax=Sphingobium xenophagum TaxID=121428 RepID=A0A249MTK0_SPHXE|nr:MULTISPECIES: hypothetical protein [Sphingobium]ASY44467.1 hypothetical protein CJD35_08455 [Sphingobium xenophagum]OUC56554.1 hypothetical protein CA262_18105 [Sphingobium sp. GW456-12-10-14-TSB1]QWT15182.1 hypothetical protein GTV57_05355 [Sphingobium xenophagum]
MTKMRIIVLPIMLSLMAPVSAFACAVRRPPHDPSKTPSDLIIEGRAGRIESEGNRSFNATTIRVDKVWLGSTQLKSVRLSWPTAPMMCPPEQPPKSSSRLMIYLREENNELVPIGWLFVNKTPNRLAIEAANDMARYRASIDKSK